MTAETELTRHGVRMTGWSWKLGRVAGTDVYTHGTFLILLAWVGVSDYLQRHQLADAGAGVVFFLALFAIIVLPMTRSSSCSSRSRAPRATCSWPPCWSVW
jgi:hypothetical protein